MEYLLTNFASAEAETGGSFFEVLGIDWQLLVIQTLAFLVLLVFLAKVVYPPLTRMLEKREEDIEASVKAAAEAEKKADAAKEEVEKLLKTARDEAKEIVATAKEEATASLEAADARAKDRAERIVADAQQQIEKDVLAAKKAIHNETLDLVALATEKVVGKTVSAGVDEKIIASAVKEAK